MRKRTFQTLYRHGNATAVTIPRYLLFELGWLPGEHVVLELLEDQSVLVRIPDPRDFRKRPPVVTRSPLPLEVPE